MLLCPILLFSCSAENTPDDSLVVPDGSVPSQGVFVTRSEYSGDLGGLVGADRLCQSAAESVDLRGTWIAWLSTDTVNAYDRVTSGGPWRDLTGQTVFANRSALMTIPLRAIRTQENGERVSFSLENVWTGTATGGQADGDDNCDNWASSDILDWGSRGITNEESWTESSGNSCDAKARLYCFEE